MQKPERQAKLLKEFGFICECEACTRNFPTPPSLGCKDKKLFKFAKKAEEEILRVSPNQAMKKYRSFCDILEQTHWTFPTVEQCLLQKYMVMFLVIRAQPSTLFP